MNTEALLSLADLIESANRFNLDTYGRFTEEISRAPRPLEIVHNCHTVACVAGWENARNGMTLDIVESARKSLGLSFSEADNLFFAGYPSAVWVRLADEYGWQTNDDEGLVDWSEINASQAADVLRRIAKGDVEL